MKYHSHAHLYGKYVDNPQHVKKLSYTSKADIPSIFTEEQSIEESRSPDMAVDPWSRPTMDDLRRVLESIEPSDEDHSRQVERLELSVPAEITTHRGNIIPAMTREISRFGVGLLHRGSVSPGEVRLKLASDTREFEYRVQLEWCYPCDGGMFMSGGRFLAKESSKATD